MWITFKSTAAAEIRMLDDLAKYLLGILGKHLDERGTIHRTEMAAALQKLEAAISVDKAAHDDHDALHPHGHAPEDPATHDIEIGLAQRAYPLLDMMRAAKAQDADILWGV
ncbi:DUF1840 domain-containing protein [Chitinasiproducens palmae]|uniref:DUF1840 domain-containing protein n=1 Tax=Chitinasiproducens palmae TaxID=1770053 RepID=A0A1H2PNT8_9BURK|nr:DUF1840 domain-containing protein [Chitinasiproducens palmae]SDV48378.1 protein of unknown function [Chitinasiproducens palmae]